MFKNFPFSGWFRDGNRSPPSPPQDVPSSFTVPGREASQLYKVSMNEASEDFVDIDCRKMSYAEVAQMSKNKNKAPAPEAARAKPKEHRVYSNQYEVLADDEPLTESVYVDTEKTKSNNYFLKNKVYKEADRTKGQKKLAKRARS
ncbi:putative DNA-directed RNA polymerases I [Clavispora lusitaniae]|uniref:DNA-directed RNA polymerases I n=1 Tax=Clavispora lusitaniae TaxID=36911 RepID=A0ACD0WP47_CLALS|nr:putative DNA-directed RNA polymerases I [Clavispora lusitaniae]QFZ34975.1 putative DNA-directed RNA polymerases I [Clavispora lusitaniae]QFZ40660.1 putative DNA-directed RNA polymerases I [Clavispora lusitaniae]QFZ46340.1 putative DNA-directed RNA polymerases I [Clavispora lusitaniae]QFZ52002.1 putative DNA-directed RNA polymerases I [Clavispora lusitaniae]